VLPLKDNVPTRSFPIVTLSLIAANVAVWIWEVTGTPVDDDVFQYGYYPCSVDGPCTEPASLVPHVLPWWEGVFSSMFMHGSWFHIAGNMLFLWIFGNNVEDSLGRLRFLVFYLLAGITATALQTFVTLAFTDPEGASIPNVGASGAIAGVLGAYFVLLPNASVLVAIFFVVLREIPAMWFLGFWFVFQAIEGGFEFLQPEASGGVAFFAHIGGFVFGALTVRWFAKRRPLSPAW
jgi:membrane associated rhomboid family serine protease